MEGPLVAAPPAGQSGGGRAASAVGRAGEELAAAWYRAAGFAVVARNWRCELGEIDLVCVRGRLLVVCEVKSRSSLGYGAPVEAIGRTKQQRLRRLAARYLADSGRRDVTVRFDVASVLAGRLEIVPNAF